MRIYIKDTPLRIKRQEEVGDRSEFDVVINTDDLLIRENKLKGNVLILNATQAILKSTLFILHNKKLKGLHSVTLISPDYEATVKLLKSSFKIIKAAGGVVYRDGKVLMIHRLGKWDFPKGKLESYDKSIASGAKREVEEECNIKVTVGPKICNTWHTYVQGGKSILKKTSWYQMGCISDSDMEPQREEGIDLVKWMGKKELDVALIGAYESIRHVYKKFRKKQASQSS
jgi:8-oxo-dGTP pyrophosphatase MutT (NUDIX family)